MKTDPDHVAFPSNEELAFKDSGLTKREYMATAAMQGLMPVWVDGNDVSIPHIASVSVRMADALIDELNK